MQVCWSPASPAGGEDDQVLSRVEGVGRRGHRLHGQDRPRCVVDAGKDLHPGVGRVHPERHAEVSVAHGDLGVAVGPARQVGEGRVEHGRADLPALAEIQVGAADAAPPAGDHPLIDVQRCARRQPEVPAVHRPLAHGEERVRPSRERRGFGGPVRGGHADGQAVDGECVASLEVERPRVARLRHQPVAQRDRVVGVVERRPGHPTHQPVAGVAPGDLGEWQLVLPTVEGVPPGRDPVRPGQQQLAPARARLDVLRETGDDVASVVRQGPERGPALGDNGLVVACSDRELVPAGRQGHGSTLSENWVHGPGSGP